MPSAEETTYLIEVMPDAGISQDSFTSRDVDVLVSRIKENLRLSGLKSRSSLTHKMRPSPYRLPSRSWADPSSCELCVARGKAIGESDQQQSQQQSQQQLQQQQQHHHHQHHHHQHHHHYRRRCRKASVASVRSHLDDSYERFQVLLRTGALIKEAVKRLQTCPEDNNVDSEEDEDVDEVEDGKRRATSTSTTVDSMDDEEDEDEDVVRRRSLDDDEDFLYRRKRFYYDEEDEPLPPVYEPLDL